MKILRTILLILIVAGIVNSCKKDRLDQGDFNILVGKWKWDFTTQENCEYGDIDTIRSNDNNSIEFTNNGHIIITESGVKRKFRIQLEYWKDRSPYSNNEDNYSFELVLKKGIKHICFYGSVDHGFLVTGATPYGIYSRSNYLSFNYFVKEN